MAEQLIRGLRRFRREAFPKYREHFERLVAEGQRPRTLFIGCSDSRVLPDLLTDAGPGDLFVARNVGAFVPPFDPEAGEHGTGAAIEYAVQVLEVADVVVCGHSHCGAVRALYEPPDVSAPNLERWLELGRDAAVEGPVEEELLRRTERRSIALQLDRLAGYPAVRERMDAGTLSLHGWHYYIGEGRVEVLDIEQGAFRPAGEG
ncbi:MAG TPA: carbonic anhydrase [Gemmatimonadota bacterium]|nr:carbonic anhydrase [Gemmatimonadota bacterium]